MIDSAGFTTSTLSNLVNDFIKGIHEFTCKYEHSGKRCGTSRIKYKNYDCFLQYDKRWFNRIQMLLIVKRIIEKHWMKTFRNYFLIYAHFLTMISISSFCCCIKIFILMNVWITGTNWTKPYCMKKKDSYSHLNMKDVTNADYVHVRRVCEVFKRKMLGKIVIWCTWKLSKYVYQNIWSRQCSLSYCTWISIESRLKKDPSKFRYFN